MQLTKSDYLALVKMYDGFKAVIDGLNQLSEVNKMGVDFACLLATRDALSDFDNDIDHGGYTTLLEGLITRLAEAQYNVAEIIASHDKRG